MEPRTHKKCPQHKKPKSQAQDAFTNSFPYRFSWLTQPTTESLKVWDSRNTPPRDLLPLQKKLVATRSIPVPGLGAPQHTASPSIYPPPPPPPQCHLWELKLLSLRFPKQARHPPFPLHSDTKDPWIREANQPSRGFS
ncbi:uncharacterized protein C3orf22 homolog [Ictidomys tridecemlineatus]|uniref:uncharacterized protein C3orf22 homolog n=1 Tax=Ictidomys tridecemlineatus TaxID=43179 RepID=UPI000680E267|nr:uncharacterized protein C3orf22 homolog [Ictidomys tridecemlineatus]XP_040147637.1 uncharacterized protein C3orf22 homolog [Ictidomys tridecemlineatus]KAG3295172.1 hypothetical protein H1C71_042241 [Ictidomys tridecemlineatus]